MPIHSIVLAVNNPPRDEVESVVKMMAGGGWRSVWCADRASLDQLLPPPERRIGYVVVGLSGSLSEPPRAKARGFLGAACWV